MALAESEASAELGDGTHLGAVTERWRTECKPAFSSCAASQKCPGNGLGVLSHGQTIHKRKGSQAQGARIGAGGRGRTQAEGGARAAHA